MQKLDIIDKKLMYELDLNARASARQLAKKLRKSKETINFRINRLIEKGFIKGFYTILNTSKLGWYYIKLYLKFKNITPEKENEILEYINQQKRIAFLANIEGYFNCIFLVMVRNPSEFLEFLNPFMKLYGNSIHEKEIVTFLSTHRMNNRFIYPGKTTTDWHYPYEIQHYKLDDTNRKILDLVSSNSRILLTEIAKKLNVDSKLVKYRLKKLEKDNIILAYVTAPNFNKLGLQYFQINISLNDPSIRKEVIHFFNSTNKCLYAMEFIGKYDIAVEVHVKDYDSLKKILDEFRRKFVEKYNEYDVSTIKKEYIIQWRPLTEENKKV